MNYKIDILIADDEPFILRSLSFIFEKENLLFKTARDGEEALLFAREFKPKIFFLDIMMPKKNGYDVCSEIKSDPGLKDIYIIMFTAKGQIDDRQKGEAAGMDEYLTKPFSPSKVLKRVKDLLIKI